MAQLQEFTLAGIYPDTMQRFVDSTMAENVTDALIAIVKKMRADNKDPEDEVTVCGLFVGGHDAKDITVGYSDERPERESPSSDEQKPFTVVTDEVVSHVLASNAVTAELGMSGHDDLRVAAVFEGHLNDISSQVDWDKYNAETPVPVEEDA